MKRRPFVPHGSPDLRSKVVVILLLSSWAGSARAQGVSEAALAEALFRDGKALFAAGQYAQACPKFAESERIDPQVGTLMNLALCHEKQGRTASAWAEYSRAATLSLRGGQTAREQVARASAAALEPKLSHVVLVADSTAPTKVTLDGETIGSAVFGTAIPIDPGTHLVVASADGRVPFQQSFDIVDGGASQTIHIPELTEIAKVAAPPPPAAEATSASLPRTVGWTLVGSGAAAVVVGSVFGVVAFKEKSAAEGQCGAAACTASGLSDVSTMKTSEVVSTMAIGAGIVAAAAGVFLVPRRGPREASAPTTTSWLELHALVGSGPVGASLSGAF
jgi:hypothetical protein